MLASYYVFSDFVLLFQVFYYRNKQPIEEVFYENTPTILEETSPLLQENSAGHGKRAKKTILAFASFITCFIGVIAIYYISTRSQQISNGDDDSVLNIPEISILPQLFGWASAILYRRLINIFIYTVYIGLLCSIAWMDDLTKFKLVM